MRTLLWLPLLCFIVTACGRPAPAVRVAGSTSVQPLAEMLAEGYARSGGGRVSIQGGGSTAGVQAVLQRVATVGAISRPLAPEEAGQGLVETAIGYDVLTVVVHPSNPIHQLSLGQVRALFSGAVTDWSRVGGAPGPVHLVTREAGSGSREAFRESAGPVSPGAIVQNSSGAIRVAVMDNPQAIGYVSLGVARMGGLKPLAINGRGPGERGYPLMRPLSFITYGRPTGEAASFIRFALSQEGQRLVQLEGLVPVQ